MRKFVKKVLDEHQFEYDLYEDCPDPIANEDESDVYFKKTDYTLFFGIPVEVSLAKWIGECIVRVGFCFEGRRLQ